MKKLLLILPIIMCACATGNLTSSSYSKMLATTDAKNETKQIDNTGYSKMLKNSRCEKGVFGFEVFQVLDYGVLASVCNTKDNFDRGLCIGYTVIIPADTKNGVYFDDQKIDIKEGQCPVYIDTYKYTSKGGSEKTVPVVKIVESQTPRSVFDNLLKGPDNTSKTDVSPRWQTKLTSDAVNKILKDFLIQSNAPQDMVQLFSNVCPPELFNKEYYKCVMNGGDNGSAVFIITDSPSFKELVSNNYNSNKDVYYIGVITLTDKSYSWDNMLFDGVKKAVLLKN